MHRIPTKQKKSKNDKIIRDSIQLKKVDLCGLLAIFATLHKSKHKPKKHETIEPTSIPPATRPRTEGLIAFRLYTSTNKQQIRR